MRQNSKRRRLRLFAALLPCALFGVIRETKSWKPIRIAAAREQLLHLTWLTDDLVCASTVTGSVVLINVQARSIGKRFPVSEKGLLPGKAHLADDKQTLLIGSSSRSTFHNEAQVGKFDLKTGKQRKVYYGDSCLQIFGTQFFTFASGLPLRHPQWIPQLKKYLTSIDFVTYYSRIYDWQTNRLLSEAPIDIPAISGSRGPNTKLINHNSPVIFSGLEKGKSGS